jgi:hypothetical protein
VCKLECVDENTSSLPDLVAAIQTMTGMDEQDKLSIQDIIRALIHRRDAFVAIEK